MTSQELLDFIKWCNKPCIDHQGGNKYPYKHKDCKECWNQVKKLQ